MNLTSLFPLVPLAAALVGGLLGGLFSLRAVLETQRVTQQRERIQYRCSKLERGYLLVQALYEGHEAEINKLAMIGTMSAADWFKGRKHPGDAMNELKMIIYMYAPQLKPHLDAVNDTHQKLKKTFRDIDKRARKRPVSPLSKTKRTSVGKMILDVEKELEVLGPRATALKNGFVAGVKTLMDQHAGSRDPDWTKSTFVSKAGVVTQQSSSDGTESQLAHGVRFPSVSAFRPGAVAAEHISRGGRAWS